MEWADVTLVFLSPPKYTIDIVFGSPLLSMRRELRGPQARWGFPASLEGQALGSLIHLRFFQVQPSTLRTAGVQPVHILMMQALAYLTNCIVGPHLPFSAWIGAGMEHLCG